MVLILLLAGVFGALMSCFANLCFEGEVEDASWRGDDGPANDHRSGNAMGPVGFFLQALGLLGVHGSLGQGSSWLSDVAVAVLVVGLFLSTAWHMSAPFVNGFLGYTRSGSEGRLLFYDEGIGALVAALRLHYPFCLLGGLLLSVTLLVQPGVFPMWFAGLTPIVISRGLDLLVGCLPGRRRRLWVAVRMDFAMFIFFIVAAVTIWVIGAY